MTREFKSLKEMKEFPKYLSEELKNHGMLELSKDVLEIKSNYYTTSSEYLGEFRLGLNKVLLKSNANLSNDFVGNINKAIESINKEFLVN